MEYGLIGEKLNYSFSKIIHGYLADYMYTLQPLSKEAFPAFMEEKAFRAINVTIPYKQDVMKYLDFVDEKAKNIGAVNTIVNQAGKLYGYNTDFDGFLYMIRHHHVHIKGKHVIVIGQGGASKAIIAVLKHLEAQKITVVYYKNSPGTITYEACYQHCTDAQVIVNTTPVGMLSKENASPIALHPFPHLEAVLDIIYNPLKTKLLLQAEEKGMKAVNGLEMLVAQAKYAAQYFQSSSIEEEKIDNIYKKLLLQTSNLVLIGMPSCGKSTIGQNLATILQKKFIDLDDEIINKIGMPIADYFKAYGEEAFRDIESSVCVQLATQTNAVIATGGGTILRKENMEGLKANGTVLFINRKTEDLVSDASRPLSKSPEALQKMYQERLPLYKKYAQKTVYNHGDFTKCTEKIVKAYFQLLDI